MSVSPSVQCHLSIDFTEVMWMRIVLVSKTVFFTQDELFYTFKDKTNMSTTILRFNGYLFEGSVSNSHLINLLSKACFEHLVCLIRAPAWRDFTVYLGHFSSKSHSSSEMLAQASWTERPSSFDFSLSPVFLSWSLQKMTSGILHLIPALSIPIPLYVVGVTA